MRGRRTARLGIGIVATCSGVACGASNATPTTSANAPTIATTTATASASASANASTPPPPAKLGDAIDVAVGREHACAIRRDHTVVCWGNTGNGVIKPTAMPGISRAEKIYASQGFTCVIDASHEAWCWGANEIGQLGSTETRRFVAEPVRVMENGKPLVVDALALGAFHACAISGGAVHCWGDDSRGQVHTGGASRAPAPLLGLGGDNAIAIAAGALHTCAIVERARARRVTCWGTERPDKPGAQASAHAPTNVTHPFAVLPDKIAASMQTTCVLDVASNVVCWQDAELSSAEQVVVSLSTSGTARALAVSGTTCWTIQHDGGVAPIYRGATGVTPTQRVAGVADVVAIGAGGDATCAAGRDGSVTCWGDNRFGQLGDGSTRSTSGPVVVVAP